jgi:hypothetical protein
MFDEGDYPFVINKARGEVISSITELARTLDLNSVEDIDKKMQATESTLAGLTKRLSYGDLHEQLLPASFNAIKDNKPEWDSSASDKLAWIVIAQALVPYMQNHYKKLMWKGYIA